MNKSPNCPQPNVLLSFLQGRLHPPQLEQCESHLKGCQLCHETLVGLSGNDTLSERIVEALSADSKDDAEQELLVKGTDSAEINNLLNRLNSDEFKRDAMRFHPNKGIYQAAFDSEVIADRAAEVLRCLTPEAESLGVLGNYTLVRLIGAGSTGVVFQAIDQKLDRTVALKVLRPSLGETARGRFLVEAKLAASIEHVNVVTILDVGMVGRLAFMAMPWLPGRTLESLLVSGEQMSAEQIVNIITQVAAGLSAAHQNQLVHRDIKPANLWICESDQQLKILDFGLARLSDDDPNLTATGMLAGTPNFMSPEQTRGLELDGRSDLFSLGCVLYRLLTRKLPFGAPTVLATLTSIQHDHPSPPKATCPEVSQHLSDLAMCLLEKQPANRPQSATQTIELLSSPRDQWPETINSYSGSSVSGTTQENTKHRPTPQTGSSSNRNNWFRSGVVALGLALIGVFGWLFAPQIIRIATDHGEVVIETDDENVEVQVIKNGELIRVVDLTSEQSFELKSGEYMLYAGPPEDAPEPKNYFSIQPGTLTMRRGERAIVKVSMGGRHDSLLTEKPTGNSGNGSDFERQLADDHPVNAKLLNKPFYQGKTFSAWFRIADLDRDLKSRADAIRACAVTAESEGEWNELINLTRQLARKHGSPLNGRDKEMDYFREAMIPVLTEAGADRTLAFFRTEIAEGNAKSLAYCEHWIFDTSRKSLGGSNELKFQATTDLAVALLDNLDNNFQSPGVLELLATMIRFGDRPEGTLDQIKRSALGRTLENLVTTGDLQQRLRLREVALPIFNNDQKVMEIYAATLLDPTLNEGSFDLKVGSQISGPKARYLLLNSFARFVFPVHGELKPVEKKSRPDSTRINYAVNAMTGVIDGVFTGGERKLKFLSVSRPFSSYLDKRDFVRLYLREFYSISQQVRDEKNKQKLIRSIDKVNHWLLSSEGKDQLKSKKNEMYNKDIMFIFALLKNEELPERHQPSALWPQPGMSGGVF